MGFLKKVWFYVFVAIMVAIVVIAYIKNSHAQQPTDPPTTAIPADVQALQSQLSGAGCNAALNAASFEIIKLRKEVATLQQQQAKSGPTKK